MSTTLVERKAWLDKHGKGSVSWQELDTVVDVITEGVADAFQKHVNARLALEQRIAELEARPLPKYLGTHQAGAHYEAHSMTTRSGSLWFATEDTTSTPGTGGAWRLIVKRGDAR